MTRYTDTMGNHVLMCDHCKKDMPLASDAFTMAPGKVADNYISRDYDRGEVVVCPECAGTIGKVLQLMGVKRAETLILLEAA